VKELARSRNIKFSKYDPIGGESLECFRHRVTCFFSYLCRLSLAWPGKCPTLFLSGAETVTKLCPNDSATSVGGAPSVVAFSHGGFLRELTVYLEKHLECDFNGKQASLPVSNTGVTKFLIKTAVDLETGQLKACAECLMLRDTSHLK
jgi:broad specificity phosphatase PhoE